MEILKIRKLADRTGEREPGEAWPLLGVTFEGAPPARTILPMGYAQKAASEGWIVLENARLVFKPAGPADAPHSSTHTFVHADAVVFKTVDGDVRYRVTRQPDKYDGGPENGTGRPTSAAGDPETSVDWFFTLEREDSAGG